MSRSFFPSAAAASRETDICVADMQPSAIRIAVNRVAIHPSVGRKWTRHDATTAVDRRSPGLIEAWGLSIPCERELEIERSPRARLRLEADLTARRLDDRLRDRE